MGNKSENGVRLMDDGFLEEEGVKIGDMKISGEDVHPREKEEQGTCVYWVWEKRRG